jgi:alkanesulfonate monooxygenase SsuD/methylene tetrahydromethanopterin reductase-like flavin-dependent oxidoreductase (luciferase family)
LNPGVRISLMIEGQEGVDWDQWLALALAAEAAGLEGLFRSDHYRSIVRSEPAGSLDAWATLAALAGRTERLRLGTMVSPVTFRPASVLAKSVVTVDRISGGRAELGIGAGWFKDEHKSYGFLFPSVRERLDELERQLAEINRQWSDADDIEPKPLQEPRPPIIIGGRAKPRTVRAAVRYADEYNTVSPTVEEARERRRAVAEAAREAGRAPLRFSMMIGCVVGRDEAEARDRVMQPPRAARRGRGATAHGYGRPGRRAAPGIRGGRRRASDAPAPRPRGRGDGRPDRRAGRRAPLAVHDVASSFSTRVSFRRPAARLRGDHSDKEEP